MIARLVNDDDVKLPHGFHETKVTKKGRLGLIRLFIINVIF